MGRPKAVILILFELSVSDLKYRDSRPTDNGKSGSCQSRARSRSSTVLEDHVNSLRWVTTHARLQRTVATAISIVYIPGAAVTGRGDDLPKAFSGWTTFISDAEHRYFSALEYGRHEAMSTINEFLLISVVTFRGREVASFSRLPHCISLPTLIPFRGSMGLSIGARPDVYNDLLDGQSSI